MFVAVACDFANDDHSREVIKLLGWYGFEKVQEGVWETASIPENALARLKRDIDRNCDSFDSIRFYQFPMEETMVITSLKGKRWRRIILE